MKKIFDIFKIKKEERVSALVALIIACALNALTVIKYYSQFSQITDNYHKLFVKTFHVAGFDPLTYSIVSHWDTEYNVYRHPLLAFFMYIPNQINQGLMMLTGINGVQFVVGAILVFCAFYSFIFLYRIFREVIGTERFDANLLSAFYFSFAYVMVSAMVPDHFIMSMTILICTLYITGVCMKKGRQLTIWQTILLFVFTAGVSLNNGLKTYLAALFTNGRKFFSIKYFLIGVLLPAALMWGFARWEYRTFVWPVEMARKEMKAKKTAEKKARQERMAQLKQIKDSLTKDSIQRGLKIITPEEIAQKAKNDSIQKAKQQARNEARKKRGPKQGAPIMKGEFMNWTDATSSRTLSIVENLMGESIQLHQDYVLQDELRHRPMFVNYRYAFNYIVEALIIILFLAGIWAGRKSRYLWLVMSYFGLDMLLHIGLGFGLNEVYIMTGHWIYALPIAIGFLLKETRHQRYSLCLKSLLLTIGLFLLIYNGILIIGYFC